MKTKPMVFTDNFIKKLKPEEADYSRGEGNGFTITVRPTGSKTWLYRYDIDGKRRKMNLGCYPEISLESARGKFNEARAKVKNGIDPMAEAEEAKQERINAPTVADLVTEYIERHAKVKKRSWAKDQAILNRDVIPAWGKRKAKDIVKRDVIHVLNSIVDRGSPIMANNCFAIIRKMFNYAVEQAILELSPCIGVKMPSEKKSCERVLTESEIKTFWQNLESCAITKDLQRALKLILLTGQRPNEVAGMHANEIDGSWWTIPVARQKVFKTKESERLPHRVYLTETALEMIGDTTGKGFIFPTPCNGIERPIGDTALAVAVGRNLAFPLTDTKGEPLYTKDGKQATINKIGVDHFTPHDLRRTAATFMSQLGEMDEVIDAVLCHRKQGIIKVYNKNRYDREKQQALESWERKLQAIITGKSADNVVSITSRKKAA